MQVWGKSRSPRVPWACHPDGDLKEAGSDWANAILPDGFHACEQGQSRVHVAMVVRVTKGHTDPHVRWLRRSVVWETFPGPGGVGQQRVLTQLSVTLIPKQYSEARQLTASPAYC